MGVAVTDGEALLLRAAAYCTPAFEVVLKSHILHGFGPTWDRVRSSFRSGAEGLVVSAVEHWRHQDIAAFKAVLLEVGKASHADERIARVAVRALHAAIQKARL